MEVMLAEVIALKAYSEERMRGQVMMTGVSSSNKGHGAGGDQSTYQLDTVDPGRRRS